MLTAAKESSVRTNLPSYIGESFSTEFSVHTGNLAHFGS